VRRLIPRKKKAPYPGGSWGGRSVALMAIGRKGQLISQERGSNRRRNIEEALFKRRDRTESC